jgi:hypothetical protein
MTKEQQQARTSSSYAQLGPYRIVPGYDPEQPMNRDLWAIPGRWYASRSQLQEMADRKGWPLTFHL